MRDLIRETVFGRIVHLVSGGKLFASEEQRDPSRLQRYIVTKSGSSSGTSVLPATDVLEGEKVDQEKGTDYELIDWIENDPEVWKYFRSPTRNLVSFVAESQELVDYQESLRYLPDLLVDHFGVYRISNIYSRAGRCHATIWRQRCSSSSWSDTVRCWLCPWTYGFGTSHIKAVVVPLLQLIRTGPSV